MILRAHLDPSIVSVIPNAVDTTKFTPYNDDEDDASDSHHSTGSIENIKQDSDGRYVTFSRSRLVLHFY